MPFFHDPQQDGFLLFRDPSAGFVGDVESPTDIALSNDTILDNAGANAVVGTLSATDPDSESHTFTLVAGAGDDDNASFNINGDELRCNDPAALGAGSYSVRVQADDGLNAPYAEALALTINNAHVHVFSTAGLRLGFRF